MQWFFLVFHKYTKHKKSLCRPSRDSLKLQETGNSKDTCTIRCYYYARGWYALGWSVVYPFMHLRQLHANYLTDPDFTHVKFSGLCKWTILVFTQQLAFASCCVKTTANWMSAKTHLYSVKMFLSNTTHSSLLL